MEIWTQEHHEAFENYIDMLTGVFSNEKASRIRIAAYKYALRDYDPAVILERLDYCLKHARGMPSPAEIMMISH